MGMDAMEIESTKIDGIDIDKKCTGTVLKKCF